MNFGKHELVSSSPTVCQQVTFHDVDVNTPRLGAGLPFPFWLSFVLLKSI